MIQNIRKNEFESLIKSSKPVLADFYAEWCSPCRMLSPVIEEIGEKYKIAPKRLASLVDIFACAFISLMPHDGGMLMITALADVSPLNVLKYSFYMFGLIIATCVTIQFGLMDEKN